MVAPSRPTCASISFSAVGSTQQGGVSPREAMTPSNTPWNNIGQPRGSSFRQASCIVLSAGELEWKSRTYGYGANPRPYRLVVVTRGGALYLAAKEGWAPAAFKASVRVILGGKLAGVLTLLP